jgi:broad specificity phosphatase PhoE
LTTLYLIRHGQAGTRDAYDSLSDLGRRQSRLLGEHFARQGVHFDAVYAGGMSRQLQTAQEALKAYAAAGLSCPDIVVEEEWNEFDLGLLYQEIAPQLCARDPQFRAEYETMLQRLRESSPNAEIHRKWQPCDSRLVEAWIRNLHSHRGETWAQFRERIVSRRAQMSDTHPHQNIAIFTSATPVAIWTGLTLEIPDEQIMRLAAVLYNSAVTTLKLRGDDLRLFAFNAIPHLPTPDLRTHR